MKTVYILVDPRDSTIHYVGTSKNPSVRLAQHVGTAKKYEGHGDSTSEWIWDVITSGHKPILVEIQTEKTFWKLIEELWILFLKACGAPLSNINPKNQHLCKWHKEELEYYTDADLSQVKWN